MTAMLQCQACGQAPSIVAGKQQKRADTDQLHRLAGFDPWWSIGPACRASKNHVERPRQGSAADVAVDAVLADFVSFPLAGDGVRAAH